MRYRVVDVFTDTPLQGNPLTAFPDARGLADGTMLPVLVHGDRGSQGIEVGGQVTPLVVGTLSLPGMDFAQPK